MRDLQRAQQFYETILGVDLRRDAHGRATDLVFPYGGQPGPSAAPCCIGCEPSVQGSIVYLSVSDLRRCWRGPSAKTVTPWCPARPARRHGLVRQFRDCEGNRVVLWSPAWAGAAGAGTRAARTLAGCAAPTSSSSSMPAGGARPPARRLADTLGVSLRAPPTATWPICSAAALPTEGEAGRWATCAAPRRRHPAADVHRG